MANRGVNKVILIGNLGKDPELRYTANGTAVCQFPLATTDRKDTTEWHNIVVWNKLAEVANQYLKKGRTVYIEGRISTNSWEDKEGNKRYRTEIIANQLQFLGNSGPSGSDGGSQNQSAASKSGADADTSQWEASPAGDQSPVEDDLPF